ncbi:MAG: DUF2267 domain-containing protein [Nocardioidaceae bacterium]
MLRRFPMTSSPVVGRACRRFLAAVGQQAGLAPDEAGSVARATLSQLAHVAGPAQARELAAWLPAELRAGVAAHAGPTIVMDRQRFLDATAEALGGGNRTRLEQHVRAVCRTVRAHAPVGGPAPSWINCPRPSPDCSGKGPGSV